MILCQVVDLEGTVVDLQGTLLSEFFLAHSMDLLPTEVVCFVLAKETKPMRDCPSTTPPAFWKLLLSVRCEIPQAPATEGEVLQPAVAWMVLLP